MRKFISIDITEEGFESRLLTFAARRKVACVMRSNRNLYSTRDAYSELEWCVALNSLDEIKTADNSFEKIRSFHEEKKDWLFGFLTYDLKNEIEKLSSENSDGLKFPSFHFFQPEYIFLKNKNGVQLGYIDQPSIESSIENLLSEINSEGTEPDELYREIPISARVSKEVYYKNVSNIKNHIQRGDIYEMNYCVEFYAGNADIFPPAIYQRLTEISPMPFSCFYKLDDKYLMCASPERYLAKRGTKIISQPIKGTARRGTTKTEDEQIKFSLASDEKEKSENVMIVDLVRNDLSRTGKKGSVKVEELFGIYQFRQLFQMISTVVSELSDKFHWTDVISNSFPMGSMTGAPKIRAMQLIEEFENTKRGLYSGAAGYVTPDGDFDFNVVIRSLLYNEKEKYLSFMVGSAITINSDPEKEYDECLLKAKAMMTVLKNEQPENVS